MTPRRSVPVLLMAAMALLLAGCGVGSGTSYVSIVGAKLDAQGGRPAIEYSIVVVADGKITAVGRQQDVPVPKQGEVVGALKSTIEALDGGSVAEGQPANLKISGAVNRTMRNGEWVK